MPTLSLFNTAQRTIEPIAPTGNRVSLYVCGVTPYDTTHLGHAFTYVVFDVLVRFLRHSGLAVVYAQNVTDIDDDILRKSKELGLPYDQLGARETARFVADMDALNVLRPDCFVPATTVMPEIVEAVQKLLEHGIAYISESNVYFDNHAVAGYGLLARTDHAHLIELAGQHGGYPDDPRKRDPLDFLLWQGRTKGEPEWPSPFGGGRPGWHIECSTVAITVLGLPVTIHGGGKDLIFPHHASEIAQAESATGIHPFVRHWMHTAMVAMDGTKMSKSLGNMVFVRELLNEYSADAIRLYLLSHHYREDFEWNRSELDRAAALANSLIALHSNVRRSAATTEGNDVDDLNELLGDDLRTPDVVGRLSQVVREDATPKTGPVLAWAKSVLGLQLSDRIFPATVPTRESLA